MELEAVGEVPDDGIPSPDDLFSSTSTWNGRDIHYQRLEFKRPRFRRGEVVIPYETHPFGNHFRQLADIATCNRNFLKTAGRKISRFCKKHKTAVIVTVGVIVTVAAAILTVGTATPTTTAVTSAALVALEENRKHKNTSSEKNTSQSGNPKDGHESESKEGTNQPSQTSQPKTITVLPPTLAAQLAQKNSPPPEFSLSRPTSQPHSSPQDHQVKQTPIMSAPPIQHQAVGSVIKAGLERPVQANQAHTTTLPIIAAAQAAQKTTSPAEFSLSHPNLSPQNERREERPAQQEITRQSALIGKEVTIPQTRSNVVDPSITLAFPAAPPVQSLLESRPSTAPQTYSFNPPNTFAAVSLTSSITQPNTAQPSPQPPQSSSSQIRPSGVLDGAWYLFSYMTKPIVQGAQGACPVKIGLLESPPEIRNRVIVVAIAPATIITDDVCFQSFNYASKSDPIPYVEAAISAGHTDDHEIRIMHREALKQLILLDPHPDAPKIDHGLQNPTFAPLIRDKLQKYNNKGGVYR